MVTAAAHLFREDGAPQRERRETVSDRHRQQKRHQHVDIVRQLEREDHPGERRPHGAAQYGAHADQRPEARTLVR